MWILDATGLEASQVLPEQSVLSTYHMRLHNCGFIVDGG